MDPQVSFAIISVVMVWRAMAKYIAMHIILLAILVRTCGSTSKKVTAWNTTIGKEWMVLGT
jgi:hypothetical protein